MSLKPPLSLKNNLMNDMFLYNLLTLLMYVSFFPHRGSKSPCFLIIQEWLICLHFFFLGGIVVCTQGFVLAK
jgi:hypothetical protein